MIRFCGIITFCYIDKWLFCVISNKSCYGNLVDNMVFYKILIISYTYTLRLLVLKLEVGLDFMHKLLIDTIRIIALANICLGILEKINLFISQSYFNTIKLVNTGLQLFYILLFSCF